jgi:hypothetical protein
MAKRTTPSRAITPPKGRPTRTRNGRIGRTRVFGPVAQWIVVTLFIALVFVVLFILTGGGDFNPFHSGTGTVLPLPTLAAARL